MKLAESCGVMVKLSSHKTLDPTTIMENKNANNAMGGEKTKKQTKNGRFRNSLHARSLVIHSVQNDFLTKIRNGGMNMKRREAGITMLIEQKNR